MKDKPSLQDCLQEYKTQLEQGIIQQAYRGLMQYMLELRTQFQKTFPDYEVPGNLYFGYMDMTYFAVIPDFLKQRKLKTAVVFLHEAFRFEAWLSGYNRQAQAAYWELIRTSRPGSYRLVPDPLKADAILEHVLVEEPDFNDPELLTDLIAKGTEAFILYIEQFFQAQE